MVQRGSGRMNGREFMESVSQLYDHYCTQIKNDAESLQCGVDWTRAFKTHEDPLYRSFVHWQGKIASCTRPVIYDVEKAAPCPPHERLNEEQPVTSEYLAEMRGCDMAGLQVRCAIAGQLKSTVSVEVQLPSDPKANSDYFYISAEGADTEHAESIVDLVCAGKERVLASPHAFSYFTCDAQVLSLAGDDCIVALMDSYYFPLAGDGRASQEWKADALHVIEQLRNKECINNAWQCRLATALNAQNRWFITGYAGTGVTLPWAPEYAAPHPPT
ncbi:uncharacterized protein ACA1_037220 [Acanthamoeba castellanii str. Neff]|uniref:Uncharacterized protein n=1 Tax=Acanthamoeba castellanii (strain ATCC 30010 / Neff) TaxID=1257118 RepID=L8H2A2_ACACF|nr:uncharacterized protein ACA1_037220 [Acanthamoeba castellanii str. Neff]ELR18888.1 hypothetical protein ACA1_037220 [Acanthamoeba castellanii str. Neff]